jgi:outer membrane immunogenic protein
MKHPRLSAIFVAASAATLIMASTAGFAAHKASHKATQENVKAENFKAEVPPPCPPVLVLRDGFYLGAGVGYDSFRFEHKVTDEVDGSYTKLNHSGTGWMGGLFAGYGHYFDTFYLGAELNANYSDADATLRAVDVDSGVPVTTTSKAELEARATYGVSLLPGLKINDSTLLFVRGGYVRTDFKASYSVSDTAGFAAAGHDSEWENGYVYGVGLESYLAEQVSIRGEFDHYTYNEHKTHVNAPDGSLLTTVKNNPSDNQFMLSLLYHFA